ncbi:helix-turn-helix domain-containing protein [Escherichia coli]|nr:hypothetical protein [Escherichia coli]EKF4352152.1 helix-turn-helix domain-containing protein [Escherichia coli O136]EFJ9855442.1 hypothetical protein [Escherichia coli]EFK1204787.1 hypothetical protein [Escherichia coli]EHK5089688.1 helix-turn-helix domain-containing protein [Escherichia coli]
MTLKEFIKSLKTGEAKKFAANLGVSPSFLSQMASGNSPVSPVRALMIEAETGGHVTRRELRPNDWELIWPEYTGSTPPSRHKYELNSKKLMGGDS